MKNYLTELGNKTLKEVKDSFGIANLDYVVDENLLLKEVYQIAIEDFDSVEAFLFARRFFCLPLDELRIKQQDFIVSCLRRESYRFDHPTILMAVDAIEDRNRGYITLAGLNRAFGEMATNSGSGFWQDLVQRARSKDIGNKVIFVSDEIIYVHWEGSAHTATLGVIGIDNMQSAMKKAINIQERARRAVIDTQFAFLRFYGNIFEEKVGVVK